MKTWLRILALGCTALAAMAQSKSPVASPDERPRPVPPGFVRLTSVETKKLQAQKNDLVLELINARNDERRLAKTNKSPRRRDRGQALEQQKLGELRAIEEQLLTGLRPDTK